MKNIHFALIGCGKIALRHIEAIQKATHATLAALCDANEERAAQIACKANVPYYLDYEEMFKAHAEIDVVTLMTPSGLHYQQAIDIIKRFRKHLLIEKPMVLTVNSGLLLKEIADQNQVTIFPIYQHRFNKAVTYVKENLGFNKALGALRVGTVRVRWCRPQRYYDLSEWRGTWAMDGGALTNQGIHFIDLLRYLCGEVKQVHAKLATLGAKIEVEDTATAILEFASGALGIIEIMTSARPDDFEASISCVCENGLAVIGGAATNELQVYTPDPPQTVTSSELFPHTYGFGHDVIIQGAVDCLLTQKEAAISFADGLESIKLLHALYKSDELNGWVDVQNAGDSKRLGISQSQLDDNEQKIARYVSQKS